MSDPAHPNMPSEPSGTRLVATLAAAGLFSGLAIVGIYVATLPIIEANNARALERAVFQVVPGSTRMQGLLLDNGELHAAGSGDAPGVYAAYDDAGTFIGYAIPADGPGFQDTIRLIYGYDPAKRQIIGMQILESRETPGLGDKIYKDHDFAANFDALSVDPEVVCVKHGKKTSDNEIDAITGATISSKAVPAIIRPTTARWIDELPGPDGVPPLEEGDAP